MNTRRLAAVALSTVVAMPVAAQSKPTYEQFLSPAYPSELVSAKKADRIAWIAYDRGLRNIYSAVAPDFKAVRLTKFLEDDGVILSELEISDDGSIVTFVRGSEPNRQGWLANPSSDPNGPERAVWAARTDGTGAWKLGDGAGQTLSPDGKSVVFVKDGQIFRLATAARAAAADKNEQPFIKEWGRQAQPRWSPDGSKLAYVSVRDNHALIAVYDVKTRKVYYVGPSVDVDLSPTWSPDGKQLAFLRRPGTPFGQQAQAGDGSIGNPGGPGAAGRGGRGGAGRGGRGAVEQAGRGGAAGDAPRIDGLFRAAFTGGYTISLMVGDIAGCPTKAGTCDAHEFWHNQPNDRTFPNVAAITWAGKNVIFQQEPEEWIRWYSVAVDGSTTTPVELTPGAGAVESTGLSRDGTTLFYATNAGDIDRRHIWRVPTAGGTATQISTGDEIEMYPSPLGSGKQVAVLTSGATRPMGVGIISADAPASATGVSPRKVVFPTLPKDFPVAAQVAPTAVVLKADDGFEFHNQLFLPKDLKPGERRPAMIFVHGGPIRQMLLGYHYMDFYAQAYAINEWLASQGYIVMSVNYRSGVGYGKSFRTAPNVGGRGNAEYKDVIAAGKWLAARADVDPNRVGIWGLSYGGVLTAQALAHNSDVFSAGVDMAGVHLWGNSLDTADVSYKSSAISAIDTWKSPVLLWQGDDDRNVEFSQTIGLVDLLRAHKVDYELIVVPDDTHETLIHKRWLYLYSRMEDFLRRKISGRRHRMKLRAELLFLLVAQVAAGQTPAATRAFDSSEVMIPMRDGIKLHTTIFRAKDASGNLPFILTRTPYGIAGGSRALRTSYAELADEGYIFVLQDIRGRYTSEGQFVMLRPLRKNKNDPKAIDEATDTYDTIEWLLKNVPNNNGRVGQLGVSYPGWLTVMSILDPHPALKAASPQASPASMFLGDDFHHNGAFRLAYGFEYSVMMEGGKERTPFEFDQYDNYSWWLSQGSLANVNPKYLHESRPTWNDFVEHPNFDAFWQREALMQYLTKVTVPTLNVAGWWDQEDFYGPVTIYRELEKHDTDHKNYLVVGPWNHGGWSGPSGQSLQNIDFGSATSPYYRKNIQAPWFAYWLKDKGTLNLAEATTFEAGANQWRSYDSWPPKPNVSSPRRMYFQANGKMSYDPPTESAKTAFDAYTSDPNRPVPYRPRPILPTYGRGSTWSTWLADDQRFVQDRLDVTAWESPVLTEDVDIAGDISAHLFAATTGTDADWVVKLIDVYPENDAKIPGYQLMVANDVLRGRFRKSFEHPEAIVPNHTDEYVVDLHTQNYRFLKGHKIRVQVQSTWFPLIDRNPQTFVPNIYKAKDSDFRVATQKIFRTKDAASYVSLPVVQRPIIP